MTGGTISKRCDVSRFQQIIIVILFYCRGRLEHRNKDGTCRIRHADDTKAIVAKSDVLVAEENAKYTITVIMHRVIIKCELETRFYWNSPCIVPDTGLILFLRRELIEILLLHFRLIIK